MKLFVVVYCLSLSLIAGADGSLLRRNEVETFECGNAHRRCYTKKEECVTNDVDQDACVCKVGSDRDVACMEGRIAAATDPTLCPCLDIDECTQASPDGRPAFPCPDDSFCVDYDPPERYKCECRSGFDSIYPETTLDPVPVEWRPVQCINIDECLDNPCHPTLATCEDFEGAYLCTCIGGYEGDGVTCVAEEEPLTLSQEELCLAAMCNENTQQCIIEETDGSVVCGCKNGYKPTISGDGQNDGRRGCEDINECTADPYPCDPNADCNNYPGFFICICNPGFQGPIGGPCTALTATPTTLAPSTLFPTTTAPITPPPVAPRPVTEPSSSSSTNEECDETNESSQTTENNFDIGGEIKCNLCSFCPESFAELDLGLQQKIGELFVDTYNHLAEPFCRNLTETKVISADVPVEVPSAGPSLSLSPSLTPSMAPSGITPTTSPKPTDYRFEMFVNEASFLFGFNYQITGTCRFCSGSSGASFGNDGIRRALQTTDGEQCLCGAPSIQEFLQEPFENEEPASSSPSMERECDETDESSQTTENNFDIGGRIECTSDGILREICPKSFAELDPDQQERIGLLFVDTYNFVAEPFCRSLTEATVTSTEVAVPIVPSAAPSLSSSPSLAPSMTPSGMAPSASPAPTDFEVTSEVVDDVSFFFGFNYKISGTCRFCSRSSGGYFGNDGINRRVLQTLGGEQCLCGAPSVQDFLLEYNQALAIDFAASAQFFRIEFFAVLDV